jgi:Ca2+/Na+ antiporter
LLKKRQETGMSLWFTHPLFLPSLIVGVTIVLWATSLLPEFITALLFFAAAMMAKIARRR